MCVASLRCVRKNLTRAGIRRNHQAFADESWAPSGEESAFSLETRQRNGGFFGAKNTNIWDHRIGVFRIFDGIIDCTQVDQLTFFKLPLLLSNNIFV